MTWHLVEQEWIVQWMGEIVTHTDATHIKDKNKKMNPNTDYMKICKLFCPSIKQWDLFPRTASIIPAIREAQFRLPAIKRNTMSTECMYWNETPRSGPVRLSGGHLEFKASDLRTGWRLFQFIIAKRDSKKSVSHYCNAVSEYSGTYVGTQN